MPEDTTVKSGTPSKNRENQDAATLTQSQPPTLEEVEARTGRPETVTPATPSPGGDARGGTRGKQRKGAH